MAGDPLNARTVRGFPLIASLFLAWGYVSANNDPLLVALKSIYALSQLEAQLTHFMFALAFGLVSLPAAALAARQGFARTILAGLGLVALGAACVALAVGRAPYAAILAALFGIASGIVLLQVAANPLAASAGPPAFSHWRLNFAQALNSIGVVLGANIGVGLLLGATGPSAQGIAAGYGLIAVLAALLALLAARALPAAPQGGPAPGASIAAALRSRWALAGAATLGLYVGAEVTISSLMVRFLGSPDILALPAREAGWLLANVYWGGALVGRLVGTPLLARIPAGRLLCLFAGSAILLVTLAIGAGGWTGAAGLLAVGLANSIMFPTVFSLTLERSGVEASACSGLLCAAILLGALLPLGAGWIADAAGVKAALALPLGGYGAVLLFALAAASAQSRGDRSAITGQ